MIIKIPARVIHKIRIPPTPRLSISCFSQGGKVWENTIASGVSTLHIVGILKTLNDSGILETENYRYYLTRYRKGED